MVLHLYHGLGSWENCSEIELRFLNPLVRRTVSGTCAPSILPRPLCLAKAALILLIKLDLLLHLLLPVLQRLPHQGDKHHALHV